MSGPIRWSNERSGPSSNSLGPYRATQGSTRRESGMSECNPTGVLAEEGHQLPRGGPNAGKPYRELLESLMYIELCVRPDVYYPVVYLGRTQ